MKAIIATAIVVLWHLIPAWSASANLLGVDFDIQTPGPSSTLYQVNTATGATTVIGATGVSELIGLAVNSSGTIYTINESEFTAANPSKLWILNPVTGAATLVGPTVVQLVEGDMTFNPVTGQLFAADDGNSNLFTINTATGAATLVGSFGASVNDVSALQFINGILYALDVGASNDVFGSVNPTTGAFTPIGLTGFNCIGFAGLAHDANGNTYLACPVNGINELFTVNLATGAATLVGPLTGLNANFTPSGLAAPVTGTAVPEPSTLSLLCSGLVLFGTIGHWTARSHRRR